MKTVNCYYVYIITNKILNKQYIGSKICYKEDPLNDGYWGSSKYLNEDYKIYGKENFTKEILKNDYNNTDDMLNGESEFILKYDTLAPNGYNRFVPNQRKSFHMAGIKLIMTEEHKRKISESHKNKKASIESKKKMSLSHSGINNPHYGKHLSRQHKLNISETKKQNGDSIGEKNPNFNGKITNQHDIKLKISNAIKEKFKNDSTYKERCCKKGKKMPSNFGKNVSQRTKGNKNPRYIEVKKENIDKIIFMYTIEKFGLVEISNMVDLSCYKIRKILIDNNIRIIKNQFKKRHYIT